jgi:hypothetical protein
MIDIADKIYAATGLTLGAEAAAKIGHMIRLARQEAADEIEKLRAERRVMQGALLAIKAHTQDAHPMSYMDQLCRIARAALGEKECKETES